MLEACSYATWMKYILKCVNWGYLLAYPEALACILFHQLFEKVHRRKGILLRVSCREKQRCEIVDSSIGGRIFPERGRIKNM